MQKKSVSAKKWSLEPISRYRGVLFGVAALWIVWTHSYMQFSYVPALGKASTVMALLLNTLHSRNGNASVDIFLLLSGLGLYYSFEKTPKTLPFYRKRALRVLPPFLIVSVIWTGVDCSGGFFTFFKRVFLLDFFTEGVTTCWYMNLILILYLVYPLLHRIIRKKRGGVAALILIVLSVAFAFALRFWASAFFWNTHLAVLRLPVFICGTYLGKMVYEKKEISRLWLWAAAAVFAACWAFFLYLSYRQIDAPNEILLLYLFCPFSVSIVLLYSAFFARFSLVRLKKVLTWFGGYSLEIYLLYEKVAKTCKTVFPVDDGMHIVYYVPVFMTTILLAIALQAVCKYLNRTLLAPSEKPALEAKR